jgi:hypothetical protein
MEDFTGSKAYFDHLDLPQGQRPGRIGSKLSCILSQSDGVSVATQPTPLYLISIYESVPSDIENVELTFIVSIQSSCILDDWHVGVNIPGCIAGPKVAVDETRLFLAPPGLERSKQTRDDLVKNALTQLSHFLINSLGFLFGVHEPRQGMVVEFFPGVMPGSVLRDRTLVSGHMESVPAI